MSQSSTIALVLEISFHYKADPKVISYWKQKTLLIGESELICSELYRDRKLNEKTNVVAQKLGDKSVFTRNDVRDVERISPIAVSPTI